MFTVSLLLNSEELRKVLRLQIWWEAAVLIPTSSAVPFWIYQQKMWELVCMRQSYRNKKVSYNKVSHVSILL